MTKQRKTSEDRMQPPIPTPFGWGVTTHDDGSVRLVLELVTGDCHVWLTPGHAAQLAVSLAENAQKAQAIAEKPKLEVVGNGELITPRNGLRPPGGINPR